MKKLILILTIALILSACAPSQDQVQTAIAQTEAAQPSSTPIPPTETTPPTSTPTRTTRPTYSPFPTLTNTPKPTEPLFLTYTGSGDSVVEIEDMYEIGIAYITGNAGRRHFAIESYDKSGNYIDLLVNTTDPYDGLVLMDLYDDEHTALLQISATGDWHITIYPFSETTLAILNNFIDTPGTYSGSGDYILFVGGDPKTATITGNANSRHFAVRSLSQNGLDLLVNTTDPYDGTVIIDPYTVLIQVFASGDWTIELND